MQSTARLASVEEAEAKMDARAGKYLVFQLGKEEYGIQVLKVREIMGIQDITAVPQTPAYLKGVINLRGKVIPVVDLRLKFNLEEIPYTGRTCIIVIQVRSHSGPLMIGIVVDGVTDVLNLASADIEDTPDFGRTANTPYLLGLAKIKGAVKILLDIDQVLGGSDVRGLETAMGSFK